MIRSEVEYKLGQCDGIVQAICDAPILPEYHRQLLLLSLQKGAQATTAIEGNTLSDEEIKLLEPGAAADGTLQYEEREAKNILETFNALLDTVVRDGKADVITPEFLAHLHHMIGRDLGERFHAVPGQFAQSQRVVGSVYRAPPPDDVPTLVSALCEWLSQEFHYPQQRFSDAVVEAVVAHVYIEWIHPFDDGNGRLGRMMEYYILIRGQLPAIASHLLSNYYNETRTEYYRQLQLAKKENDLTRFLNYAVTGLVNGLQNTLKTVQLNAWTQLWRVAVYDAFQKRPSQGGPAVKRQRLLALALPLDRGVPVSDLPGLTSELFEAYATKGTRSLLRDVAALEELDLITRNAGFVRAKRSGLEHARPERRRQQIAGQQSPA
jgi:Fic family protein